MDLFKFVPGPDPTDLRDGLPINGATSISWTERYREPGEFEIVAPVSSGLIQFLPLGTIISHTNTLSACIVENHNIKDKEDIDPVVSITGRSLEVVLEDRIVGANLVTAIGQLVVPYTIDANPTWEQAVQVINEHIAYPDDVTDVLLNFYAWASIPGTWTTEPRTFPRDTVHKAVLDILGVDNLGIKVVRRNPFGVEGTDGTTHFIIHSGYDRTQEVILSWQTGDLGEAEYLWSNRVYRNSAMVVGQYVNVRVDNPAYHGYSRTMIVVPGDDIDSYLSTAPLAGSPELAAIVAAMRVRGNQALSNLNEINLIRADMSETSNYQYRVDYNVGDIVTVDGNFGEIAPMRVVEYVEIQDENEERGHPTFETPNPIP